MEENVVELDDILIDARGNRLGIALIIQTYHTIAFIDHCLHVFVIGMLADFLESKILEIDNCHVFAILVLECVFRRKSCIRYL